MGHLRHLGGPFLEVARQSHFLHIFPHDAGLEVAAQSDPRHDFYPIVVFVDRVLLDAVGYSALQNQAHWRDEGILSDVLEIAAILSMPLFRLALETVMSLDYPARLELEQPLQNLDILPGHMVCST